MKNILNLMLFAVLAVFTQVASAHDHNNSPGATPTLSGWWDVESPLVDDGFIYSTGKIHFEDDVITFETTCSFHGGLEMKAIASSALNVNEDYFTILQNQQAVTRSGNATCVANLVAGPVEYSFHGYHHLEIFNRSTGFHMELVNY